MKLHLPLSLRSALLAACALVGINSYAVASTLTKDMILTNSDAGKVTYTMDGKNWHDGWNGIGYGYMDGKYMQFYLYCGADYWYEDKEEPGVNWVYVPASASYDGDNKKFSYKVSIENQLGTAWFLGGGSVTFNNMDEISIEGTSASNSSNGIIWYWQNRKVTPESINNFSLEGLRNTLHLVVSNSNSFSFAGNNANDQEGSVTTGGSVLITKVDKVEFSKNTGSLFANCSDGNIVFKDCGVVVFDGNKAREGVIVNSKSLVGIDDPMPDVLFENCTGVIIRNNTVSGGWLFASALPVLKNIDTVEIIDNTTEGGVLLARNITLDNIRKDIRISNNSAKHISGDENYWDGFMGTYQEGFITFGSMDTHSADPSGIVASGDASTMKTVFEMSGNTGYGDFSCFSTGTIKLSYFDRVDINGNKLESTVGNTGGLLRYLQLDHINEINIKDNSIRSIDDQKYGEYGVVVVGKETDFYITADKVTISGNSNVATTAAHGGAMCLAMFGDSSKDEYTYSLSFTGIKELRIENNWAQGASLEADYVEDMTLGGAIYVSSLPTDSSNFPTGKLEFVNNDHVVMRGNYITDGKKYILNAISTHHAPVILKAGEGQMIECYDGLIIKAFTADTPFGLEINGDIADQNGSYKGTVVFSAKYAEEDLKKINPNYTQEELLESSSVVADRINVYNGTLRLDNARLEMSCGVTHEREMASYYFVSKKEAMVEMIDSVIHTEASSWLFFDDSARVFGRVVLPTASFTGSNTINASQLIAENGTWTFNVGAVNKNNALLHIGYDGGWAYGAVYSFDRYFRTENQTFEIKVANGLGKGTYKLIDFEQAKDLSQAPIWADNRFVMEWIGQNSVTLAGEASGKIAEEKGKNNVYFTIDSKQVYTLWFEYGGSSSQQTPPTDPQPPVEEPTPAQRGAATLTWAAANGTWTDGKGADAKSWTGEVSDLNFYTGDSVVFDKAAAVTVGGVVRPADMLVKNAEGQVVFTSSNGGQITGNTGITKDGAGELVLNLANAYTGATTVKAGKLTAGDANALGLSTVELQGGELNLGDLAVSNNIHATGAAAITGGSAYAGRLTLEGGKLTGDAINLSLNAELLSGSIANDLTGKGSVVKNGSGTVTLSGKSTHKGATTVNGGTLVLNGALIEGTLVVNEEGKLDVSNSTLQGVLSLHEGSEVSVDKLETSGLTLETDAEQSISGNVHLNGGKVVLGGTLNIEGRDGKLSSTEDTEVLVCISDLKDADDEGEAMDIFTAKDISGLDVKHVNLTQLVNSRATVGTTDVSVWVKLNSETLTWDSATTGTWDVKDAGGEWLTDDEVNDKHFFDYDDVIFDNAGTVDITGVVTPGDIMVEVTEKDGVTEFTSSNEKGAIAGEAELTKTGKGTLKISTDNKDYTGDITIVEGIVDAAHENALGNGGDVLVSEGGKLVLSAENAKGAGDIGVFGGVVELKSDHALGNIYSSIGVDNGVFDGGNHILSSDNVVVIGGKSEVHNTKGVGMMVFASSGDDAATPANVSGDFTLASGNTLIIDEVGAIFSGDFTFAGGTLYLTGGLFELTGHTMFRNGNATERTIDPSKSTIHLAGYDIDFGGRYELMTIDINGIDDGADVASMFNLTGLDDDMAAHASLAYEGGSLWLTINLPGGDDEIAKQLSGNQRSVYYVLGNIAESGSATGLLREYANEVAATSDAAWAAALTERLGGSELATTMLSQIEGNLAHMRRVRTHIGSGQLISAKQRMSAYVVGYDDRNHVQADASGRGIRRNEMGASLGFESAVGDKALIGATVSNGRAKVTPNGGSYARRYHEEATRFDVYGVANFANGWQSVSSFGIGLHDYNISRELPGGIISKSKNMDGTSINFSQEVNYTQRLSAENSLQPFFSVESSVNHISSFSERGADTASLAGDCRSAWATDLTLGARFIQSFNSGISGASAATLTVQSGLVASVGDTTADLNAHFVGAPQEKFRVRTADRNRWGYNLSGSVAIPVSENTTVTGSAGAIMRGDSEEVSASVGLRVNF